jgi:hypothetical protein
VELLLLQKGLFRSSVVFSKSVFIVERLVSAAILAWRSLASSSFRWMTSNCAADSSRSFLKLMTLVTEVSSLWLSGREAWPLSRRLRLRFASSMASSAVVDSVSLPAIALMLLARRATSAAMLSCRLSLAGDSCCSSRLEGR